MGSICFAIKSKIIVERSMNGNSSSVYSFQASASSVSGQLQRPSQITVSDLKAVELPEKGGHYSKRLSKYHEDGLVSFEEAYLEVGGSYDEDHERQTSYALVIIDGLNVAGMLTADRVVSRMMVYSPIKNSSGEHIGEHIGEHTFDITGSYFDNLKIAGHKVDLKLDTFRFHEFNSYTKFTQAYISKQADDCFLFNQLNQLGNQDKAKQNDLMAQYSALKDVPRIIQRWQTYSQTPVNGPYLCSAAGHLDFKDCTGPKSELEGFGAVICIPKFGVIRLAEVEITRDSARRDTRTLRMFRVDMCSTGHGTTDGGTTVGGPVPPSPP
jgi:hypothetical protein